MKIVHFGWRCHDCHYQLLVENNPDGPDYIHDCYECGSTAKEYRIPPIKIKEPKPDGGVTLEEFKDVVDLLDNLSIRKDEDEE